MSGKYRKYLKNSEAAVPKTTNWRLRKRKATEAVKQPAEKRKGYVIDSSGHLISRKTLWYRKRE